MLNINIPYFKCLVRRSHYTHNEEDVDIFDEAYAFGVQSVTGKILTFHIMTDFGMLRSRVPLSEIFLKRPVRDIPFYFKQLWDCFSENAAMTEYSFLKGKRCEVVLRDKVKVWATYLFTIDWYDNPYSNEPSDYKAGHVLAGDEGYLLCMPNNRIYWKDSNWITKSFPLANIKVDKELPSVESVSDKWVSEDGDSYYYDLTQI
jgi:hypothetical protein